MNVMLTSDNTVLPLIIILVLLIFVMLIILIIMVTNFKKSISSFNENTLSDFSKYKNELIEQNNVLAKQLLEQQKNSEINNGKHKGIGNKCLVDTFVRISGAIKENCILAMNDISAVRLAIYLFHNGTSSTHGISFLKISCICEKVAIGSGVRERMIEHTNIPINLFDEMIGKMIVNDRYIIINKEDEIQNSNHKMFISSDKITYAQLIPIYDINNNMLGFVEAEMEHVYSKDVADKEKSNLNLLVKQLVPILSYSEYATINSHE